MPDHVSLKKQMDFPIFVQYDVFPISQPRL
jgi:hypothetical protein